MPTDEPKSVSGERPSQRPGAEGLLLGLLRGLLLRRLLSGLLLSSCHVDGSSV